MSWNEDELARLRELIRDTDDFLLILLHRRENGQERDVVGIINETKIRRLDAVFQIGVIKIKMVMPIIDQAKEDEEILRLLNVVSNPDPPLDPPLKETVVIDFFRAIFAKSRAAQEDQRRAAEKATRS